MEALLAVLLYLNSLFVGDAALTERAMDEFAIKMEPYYAAMGLPTDTGNASLYSIPDSYWGATVWAERCTAQVFLSEGFRDPNHPFYNTPMWKYVLAHEWAHVAQGIHCWQNEAEAQLIALAVLAESGEWGALITALEWMFTLHVSDGVMDQLHIPPREKAYYHSVSLPGTGIVQLLLDDDDGIYELRTGQLEAQKLWNFVHILPQESSDFQEFTPR